MLSGKNLIHALETPTSDKLFLAPVFARAKDFDAHVNDNHNLLAAFHDTLAAADPESRAASLSLSTSNNALSLLDHDAVMKKIVDAKHEETALEFASLSPEKAAAVAAAIAGLHTRRNRLFAFRQLLPSKSAKHADSETLRLLAPNIPHLPEASRAEASSELFERVHSLGADQRATTLGAIASDLHVRLQNMPAAEISDAERAERPIAAHLIKELQFIGDGESLIHTFNTVHPVAVRLDDGLMRDKSLPVLESRAVQTIKQSQAAAQEFDTYIGDSPDRAHAFSDAGLQHIKAKWYLGARPEREKIVDALQSADLRALHAWQVTMPGRGYRRPENLTAILGKLPERETMFESKAFQELYTRVRADAAAEAAKAEAAEIAAAATQADAGIAGCPTRQKTAASAPRFIPALARGSMVFMPDARS